MNSLNRACLRLAALAALRNATMAQDRVFDSRIGALDRAKPEEIQPLITVFTEDQHGDALARQNGGPPFKPTVDLVLEIAMAACGEEDGAQILLYPATSADLELSLDLIEMQARRALFDDPGRPATLAFLIAHTRVEKASSMRFTNAGAQERIAVRYVTYTIEIPDDEIVTFDASATGLARLPATFRRVAALWDAGGPERASALVLASALAQPTTPLLKSLAINPASDPPNSGDPENWTPPDPPAPVEHDGPTIVANWNLAT